VRFWFFLGFEFFGLPYVLEDREGRLVLATYPYKFNTLLGKTAYQLMAVVVIIMLITLPLVSRAIVNTILLGLAGSLTSLAVYLLISLASHRSRLASTRILDFLVLLPRAIPGIVAALLVFWLFLFILVLKSFVSSLGAMWVAYTLVWLSFGLRLVSNAFSKVGKELEEAAFVAGDSQRRVAIDVILPLVRGNLLAAWLLALLLYSREYSTGIFLMGQGNEVMGVLLVSLWNGANIDLASTLAVIKTAVIGTGIAVSLKLGVRLDD